MGARRTILISFLVALVTLVAARDAPAAPPKPLPTPSWIHDVSVDVTKPPYGATCDTTGQTDATAQVQAAIDAVGAQGGGGVLIPCSLRVSRLTLRSNVTLYGLGTATSALIGNGSQDLLVLPDETTNVGVRGLTLRGGLNGILSQTLSTEVSLADVRFENPAEAAVRIRGSIERWVVAAVRAAGGMWFYKHDIGLERGQNYVDKVLFRDVVASNQSRYAFHVELQWSHSLTLLNPTVEQAGMGALYLAGGFRGTNVVNLVTRGSGRLLPGQPEIVVAGSPATPSESPQTLNFIGGSLSAATSTDLEMRDPGGKVHLFGTPGWRMNAPNGNVLVFGAAPVPTIPALPDVPATRYDVTKPPFNAVCNGADSTGAVQNAIDRATGSGAGVYIPCPVNVTSLTLRSGIHFYGKTRRFDDGRAGSALIGSPGRDLFVTSRSVDNVSFRNLNLYGGRNTIAISKAASRFYFDRVTFALPAEAAIRTSAAVTGWFINDSYDAGGRWFFKQDSAAITDSTFVQIHTLNDGEISWALNATAASSATFVNSIIHFPGRSALVLAGPYTTTNVTGVYTEGVGRSHAGEDAILITSNSSGFPDQVHLVGGFIGGHTSYTRSEVHIQAANRVYFYGPGYWKVIDPGGKAVFYGGFAELIAPG